LKEAAAERKGRQAAEEKTNLIEAKEGRKVPVYLEAAEVTTDSGKINKLYRRRHMDKETTKRRKENRDLKNRYGNVQKKSISTTN
jgi:hypothetical protein